MNNIAIVGLGGRFAGAPDVHAYWDLLREGRDAFGPIPADRWSAEAFYDENKRATDKSYAPAGGFIDDVRSFPALHFGIPPRRVEVMDPQQRLSIEVALQAIEDAGYRPSDLPRRTGVFMGVTALEFRMLLSSRILATVLATGQLGHAPDDPEAVARLVERVVPSRPFSAPGVLANMVAAAVAQELDLHGPAYTVDAACASALVALADAVNQLRSGVIDAAVAGGVYLQLSPENYVAFSKIGAISGKGRCRPFDREADGFVQGDGAGALVLKRVADAQRDGDRIYAVIEGIATNNDGRGDGPMAPVMEGQIEVIRQAWADAQVDPARLGYIEAHGTGTEVGDETELAGLREVFGKTAKKVMLGSSKANVGHTMSAAGIAGVLRAVLAIHHRTIPPLAGFEQAKPALGLDQGPFAIPTQPTPWKANDRVAGVSSFGFGGTNGHVVLRSVPAAAAAPKEAEQLELVRISAPDQARLRATAERLARAVREEGGSVASFARAWAHRPGLTARAAFVAGTREELHDTLQAIARGERPTGVAVGEATGPRPKVALLFPGQGAQRVGMLHALRERFPVVAQAIDEAERDLEGLLDRPLTHLLYPELRAESVTQDDAEAELTFTSNCQPALVAAGIALWRLLQQVGVEPVVAGGHSLGEFAAAVVGGVLTPRDAVRFAAMRGAAMAFRPGDTGTMAALVAGPDEVRELLVDGVVIANENHPRQTVVSGPTGLVVQVVKNAQARGIESKVLKVSHAFHSPLFADLDADAWIKEITISEPTGPRVASGIADQPYGSRDDVVAVFRRHAYSPVRFGRLVEQCVEAGADLFLQVGAGGPLASFVRKGAGKDARDVLTLASYDDHDRGRSALETLGALWIHGVPVDLRGVVGAAPVASVPPIELPREPYWPVQESATMRLQLNVEARAAAAAPPPAAESAREEAPAAVESADEVFEKVAAVVSKVSSYPRNAIRAELGLVDQLGFDSLMVTDLANGLAEAFPGLGGLPQELLLDRPTVGVIADYVRGARGEGGSAANDDEAPLLAYEPRWVPCPLPESGPPQSNALLGRTVLVIGARDLEVTSALKNVGATVIDFDVEAGWGKGLDAVHHVVVMSPFDEPTPPSAVFAGEAPVPDRSASLVALLDQLVKAGAGATRGSRSGPNVLVVARADDPWAEADAGVIRSVAREWPDRVAKLVRFDDIPPAYRAARIVQEFLSEDLSPDVSWSAEGRKVSGQVPRQVPEAWMPGPSDRVLVTGGTRGIGAKFAERLLATGAGVVLVGRGAPSELAARLLAANPGRAHLVQVDITDRRALTAALAALPCTAVVHCAGVLADGPVGEVDAARGQLARQVKVDGFLNALSAAGSPKVALAVGSWAGRFGNRHQAYYAAANAQLASLATVAPRGVRVVVAEFGPWSGSDMVATIPKAVQATMRTEGIDFVGDGAGLDALWADLCGAAGVVVHGRRLPHWNRVRVVRDELSIHRHPYLLDHAIDGVPVLPLAMACDLLAAAAGVPHPYEVRDLRLYTPVTVKEKVAARVVVRGDRVELRIGEKDTLAYRATVQPAVGPAGWTSPDPTDGVLALTVDHFYKDVTFHGALFHGVASLKGVSQDALRGRVKVARVENYLVPTTRTAWAVDPLALDSAFQLGAMVAWERYRRAGTPVSLGRLVVVAPFPTSGTLDVEGRFGPPDGDRSVGSFALTDGGRPIAYALEVAAELKRDPNVAPFAIERRWIDPTEWPELKDLDQRLEAAMMLGIENPYFHVHEGTARDTTVVAGKTLVNFSSYNYLGLSGDERVAAAVKEAVDRYGTSVSASRVASGERPYHRELERELAEAQGVDDALVFTAGHMTNVNAIATVMKPQDLILHDELIHESLHQGIRMSGANRRGFRHDDPEQLEKLLRDLRPHYEKCLVVVEGVYSMDGDICALPEYIRLKQKYGALLMVDEAHSFGVCGPTGRGVAEHYRAQGVDPRQVDLWMGTLSKSLSSCGGWIGGSAAMIRLLRYTAGGFVYSAGITPANGVAALTSLRLMMQEPWRVAKLQSNAKVFHDALVGLGVDTGPAKGGSGVVPAVTGNSMHALLLSSRLRAQGVNVQPIVYPAVADDAARLRFFLSSTHSEEQLRDTAKKVHTNLEALRAEFPAPK